ncbi:MAG: hypothetical protein ABIR24_11285, partial [Verrucomicrobiota bacterium]
MNTPGNLFSANKIALELGWKRQAVQRMLAHVAPDGKIVSSGNETAAWHFESLTEIIRKGLLTAYPRRGFRSVYDLLNAVPAVWPCPLPISAVQSTFVDRAYKLRDALTLPLQRQHLISSGELTQLGLKEFQKAFGYSIGGKQWRRLFDRTVSRDGGCENFLRVEIFLDSAAFQRSRPTPAVAAKLHLHRCLDEIISNLENKSAPTLADREWIFTEAFRHFEKLLSENEDRREQKHIKKSLVKYLFCTVPRISKTEFAMRRAFEINLQKWRVKGQPSTGWLDMRPLKSGNFRTPDFAEDKKKIGDLSISLGGNESLAYRKLRRAGKLSQGFIEHFHYDVRRAKSYVPKSIREEITPRVNMCLPRWRSEREEKAKGPYIPGDHSDYAPGDYFTGDDVTWNHSFFYYDERGQLHIERGECLVLVDRRSNYIIDFVLIAGKYNSRHIRSLISKVHDKHGLPRKGWKFERGVWDARL